jgi:hypothetical protein
MRLPLRILVSLGVATPVLALPGLAQAQNYNDLPPLAPMPEAEMRSLPPEYRQAPIVTQTKETVTTADGVETITRTRRIETRAPAGTGGFTPAPRYAPDYPQTNYPHAPAPMAAAPIVFERQQWLDECRRRTRGRSNDETGLIIGALLGAVVGGVAGYEIAGAGDRVAGAALGLGGGGLIGGLLGSLFGGGKKKDRYDCEAALDGYLTQYGAPGTRIASREIAYAPYPGGPAYGYGYPAGYSYGYTYAPPQQIVMVPARSEVQQQVVVRETIREETYTVPGALREITTPRPSPKMIKSNR